MWNNNDEEYLEKQLELNLESEYNFLAHVHACPPAHSVKYFTRDADTV
jgi:hypothetical protein